MRRDSGSRGASTTLARKGSARRTSYLVVTPGARLSSRRACRGDEDAGRTAEVRGRGRGYHAARVRGPFAAGLHPGAVRPPPLGGNGSHAPAPSPPPSARRVGGLEARFVRGAAARSASTSRSQLMRRATARAGGVVLTLEQLGW